MKRMFLEDHVSADLPPLAVMNSVSICFSAALEPF